MPGMEAIMPPIFGVAAAVYLGLAVHVLRSSPQSVIGFLIFLMGVMVAGSAFAYGASDATLFNIGRVMNLVAAALLPVAFYVVYRQFTAGPPNELVLAMLLVVPLCTTALALTNYWHGILWTVIETDAGLQYSAGTDSAWFNRLHAPYSYGLFAFAAIALMSRLSSIAPAQRRTVTLMLVCALLPFSVSFANNYLDFGVEEFPYTSAGILVMLPLIAYVALSLKVYEFSPVAYQMLFDHVRDPIIVLDNHGSIICVNRKAAEMLGPPERELLGKKLWEDFPDARALLEQAKDLDLTQTLKLNTNQVYELSVAPLLDSRQRKQGLVVVCRDVTERRQALSKLADSEHLIRTLIETSSNGILRFARDAGDTENPFRCVYANRAAESHLGNGTGTLVGMPLHKVQQIRPERLLSHFTDARDAKSPVSFEIRTESDRSEGWLRIVGEPVGEDFSVTLIDITSRKRQERKMMADALSDPLTGVLNRRGFEKDGRACLRNCASGAVLYLDLNSFKSINDRFGHQAGDALLKAFGHRLGFCLRPEDILGRLGGDEFAIVLPGVTVDDAKHVARRLVATASEAYIIQGQEIRCSASVGIALLPQHGEELWHLISVADHAMYKAKSVQRGAANDTEAYIAAAIASWSRQVG
jgi:diguanylate cyclase (GGDEF)-like protein/PAS domain S-box-containing protein